MTIQTKKPTTYRREIYQRAIVESFIKLNPRLMVRNPVMFVVEVGSVLTTALWIQALAGQGEAPTGFHRSDCALAVVHCAVCKFLRGCC